ncbi:MAG: hypothetical protein U0527_09795 [Candidatus Eisenbacteria bacterium]
MLSDEEKRELLALARSESVRAEFRAVKEASRAHRARGMNVDQLIEFLTVMNRFAPAAPREFVEYRRVLL